MEQSTILNEKYERMDFELSQEATENLKFYQANILGLTDELTQLRGDDDDGCSCRDKRIGI